MKQNFLILTITFAVFLAACHSIGDKTKEVINKTGEAVGEGSSEFVKGVKNGVETTFNSDIVISEALKQRGVSYGKFNITNDSGCDNKNKLTIYLIFDKDFSGDISTKVYDKDNREYGRATITITAKHSEAKYADFIFDRRTDIESKSKFVLE